MVARMTGPAHYTQPPNALASFTERLTALGPALAQTPLRKYKLHIIPSGFGDMLHAANWSAALLERAGLAFDGFHLPAPANPLRDLHSGRRDYYDALLSVFSISADKQAPERTRYFSLRDISTDHDALINALASAAEEGAETFSIVVEKTGAFDALLDHPALAKAYAFNAFNEFIRRRFDSLIPARDAARTKPSLTIHIRLGDTAVLPLYNSALCPLEFLWERPDKAVLPLKTVAKRPALYDQMQIMYAANRLIEEARVAAPGVTITLVSDGYGFLRRLRASMDFAALARKQGLNISDADLDAAIDRLDGYLNAIPADEKLIGEDGPEDFLASARAIADADICISSARSFAFNMLANFRPPESARAVFFSRLPPPLLTTLEQRNIAARPFELFAEAIPDVIAELRDRRA